MFCFWWSFVHASPHPWYTAGSSIFYVLFRTSCFSRSFIHASPHLCYTAGSFIFYVPPRTSCFLQSFIHLPHHASESNAGFPFSAFIYEPECPVSPPTQSLASHGIFQSYHSQQQPNIPPVSLQWMPVQQSADILKPLEHWSAPATPFSSQHPASSHTVGSRHLTTLCSIMVNLWCLQTW